MGALATHPAGLARTRARAAHPPEARAAAALHRLAEEDPKCYAQICGGSRERAEELGFPWPDDTVPRSTN
ncbi:hypothetical protein ABT084_20375 [Streptomyces sp. NPDC002138]|uniref:hypothetical protein n=1 Tax=Streptomyces sp. NPDC002138 TaxID=3154410 RepID=UPI00331892BD